MVALGGSSAQFRGVIVGDWAPAADPHRDPTPRPSTATEWGTRRPRPWPSRAQEGAPGNPGLAAATPLGLEAGTAETGCARPGLRFGKIQRSVSSCRMMLARMLGITYNATMAELER